MKLIEFRQKFPQYNDMDDVTLAKSLHQRHYSDIPFEKFSQDIGLSTGERSYGERVLKETLPAMANIGADVVGNIAGGVAAVGSYPMLKGAELLRGAPAPGPIDVFKQTSDFINKNTPRFDGQRVKDAQTLAQETVANVVEGIGNIAEDAALKWRNAGWEEQLQKVHTPQGTAYPAVRGLGELSLDLVPIPGAALVSRIPRIGSKARAASAAAKEAEKNAAMIKEAEDLAARLDSEKQQAFTQNATQPELPGFDQLRREAEPRTPYNMPDNLREQLEAELNPAVEQRQFGQQELFGDKPLGVEDVGRQRQAMPLDYTPVEGGTTQGGKMALGIGEEALRPGAGPEQLTMPGLDYPTQKPRLTGPKAQERPYSSVYKDDSFERRSDEAEAEFKARVDAMNERQRAKESWIKQQREDTSRDGSWLPDQDAKRFKEQLEIRGRRLSPDGPLHLTLKQGLETLKPYLSKVEQNLADKISRLAGIRQVTIKKELNTQGWYFHRSGEIAIGRAAMTSPYMWLHEGTHAALVDFQLTRPNHPLNRALYQLYVWSNKDIKQAAEQITKRQISGDKIGGKGGYTYGFVNVREFIAEAMSRTEFRNVLKDIKLTPEQIRYFNKTLGVSKGILQTVWDAFKALISKVLKLKPDEVSVLDKVLELEPKLFEEAAKTIAEDRITLHNKDVLKNQEKPFEQEAFHQQQLQFMEPDDFTQTGDKTTLQEFKQDLKARKIAIPDAAIKAIYEAQNKPTPKPTSGLPTDASIKVASNIDGLKQIQRQYADRRTFEEIKAEVKSIPADTISDKAGLNTIGKIINGRFISKDNPLLSWTSSQIHWTKQDAIAQANAKLHGSSRKRPDEGTYNFVWQQLSRNERIAVNDVGQALNNAEAGVDVQAKAREVLGRELTKKELQAYNDRIRINKEVLGDLNKFLRSEGREPINELPHYWSPAVFDGPFKVRFVNAAGDTVKVEGFYTKPNAEKLQKAVGDEYKVEILPDSGLRGDLDFDQFEWILRQLAKEQRDPAAKAITEGLRRMGFGKHGLKRKGAKGARGTEGGTLGLRRYEETSERYIRQAYDYLANRKLDKLHKDVLDMEEANHLPYTKAYAVESIDVARGGSNRAFDEFSRLLSSAISGTIEIGTAGKLVLPQRFTRDLLRHGNKIKTTLLLGFFHPIHIGAQILQTPTFMPPKLMAMAAESGLEPTTTTLKAMAKGLSEYAKWNDSPDAKKLQEVGAFDATFKYDWSTYAGDSNPQYKRHIADTLTGIEFLSGVESHAVRRPAAHMFLAMLRELGYDKIARTPDEIYKVAREMTDHYMVSNRHYEKSHMFSRSGLVGMATSPLQSFSTTWLGMLREYMKLSAEGISDLRGSKGKGGLTKQGSLLPGLNDISLKDFIAQGGSKESYYAAVRKGIYKQFPLAAFIAANLLTAGMLGMVGVKEWDAIASFLNKYFGYNVPSGTEYILSKFKSTKARFGLLSDALGIHVGATFNAPTLTGSFAPGVQALGDVGVMGWQGLKATGILGEENKPTNVEMRDAMKNVFPRFSVIPGVNWGDIEKHYTPPGAPYQESSGAAGPYTRDKTDELARRFGSYTNKEATEKTEFYTAKKKMTSRQAKFGKAMNRAVDIILTDPQSTKELDGLWKKLVEQGFSGQDIAEGLKREIRAQMMEADLRGQGKLKSTRQQQLALLLQRLGGQ